MMADGFDDDMTRCPCCDGEGYFYAGDEPPSPWGDAATIARLTRERDEALAKVAAAFEAAADAAINMRDNCGLDPDGVPYLTEDVHMHGVGIADAILHDTRALTPADATAALTRVRAEVYRDAAGIAAYLDPDEGQDTDWDRGYEQACSDKSAAILARADAVERGE